MKKIAALAMPVLLLAQGCAPVVAGTVATAGTTVAQERTVGHAVDDATINARINSRFVQKDLENLYGNVDVDVTEGRVMLTGAVRNPDTRKEAERISWEVPGVVEVINEIQVTNHQSFQSYAQDSWITTQVKSKLLFTKNIRSVNYGVDTINGVVYLMGIAQNAKELEWVTSIASRVKGVKKVVSHVWLKDDPRRGVDSGGKVNSEENKNDAG